MEFTITTPPPYDENSCTCLAGIDEVLMYDDPVPSQLGTGGGATKKLKTCIEIRALWSLSKFSEVINTRIHHAGEYNRVMT